MKIGVPKEVYPKENRIPLNPQNVEQLVNLGAIVEIENGMGESCEFTDEMFTKAGAQISTDRKQIISSSDIVLRLRKPPLVEISWQKKDALHISYLDPFYEKEIISEFKKNHVNAISMELIPRTTLAQKMDALSSQASLAGYVAVILAADKLDKIFPMMMTPAGTIAPARVFIIGAGVAGLQAIASAKRLGARVEAFDTREVVAEQVESLGARFVKVDLGETGQTKDGYARALTDEQLKIQRDAMAKHCALADIVITTAQVFGRKAPVIVTREMIEGMRSGSVIVDLAAETGGNVEGSKPGETIEINGVHVIGAENLPGHVAIHASQMYSSNVFNLLSHFWDKEKKELILDLEDEIIKGCLVTHGGEIFSEALKTK